VDYDPIVRGSNVEVAVSDGLITAVGAPGTVGGSALEELDASALFSLPGGSTSMSRRSRSVASLS
jgi:hypothetical protein